MFISYQYQKKSMPCISRIGQTKETTVSNDVLNCISNSKLRIGTSVVVLCYNLLIFQVHHFITTKTLEESIFQVCHVKTRDNKQIDERLSFKQLFQLLNKSGLRNSGEIIQLDD